MHPPIRVSDKRRAFLSEPFARAIRQMKDRKPHEAKTRPPMTAPMILIHVGFGIGIGLGLAALILIGA